MIWAALAAIAWLLGTCLILAWGMRGSSGWVDPGLTGLVAALWPVALVLIVAVILHHLARRRCRARAAR
ncbi:MAG: hypothetical protein ACXWUN_04700 [Allosphingosinicella sp.]